MDSKFSVVHIHNSEVPRYAAGGGFAMNILHQGLRNKHQASYILCRKKGSNDAYTQAIPKKNPFLKIGEQITKKVTKRMGLNDIHVFDNHYFARHPYFQNADIVTLHCTHHRTMNYLRLPRILSNKKVVFVLHDFWALSGHCVFHFDCDRWQTGCGQCPYLDIAPAIKRDATHLEWKLKKDMFSQLDITFVSPSKSVLEKAKKSLIQNFPIEYIPHGIDEKCFAPVDKLIARRACNLPLDKFIILISSVSITDNRKGFDLFCSAIEKLPTDLKQTICIAVMGRSDKQALECIQTEVRPLGFIDDIQQKCNLFSSADIFVHPSRAETFGLVVLESLACGTPAVGFAKSGLNDLILPNQTGLLAENYDSEELKNCILTLLEDESLRKTMGFNGRKLVEENFRLDQQIDSYIDLYQRLTT